jgi:hypothetical protein
VTFLALRIFKGFIGMITALFPIIGPIRVIACRKF